MLSIIEIHTSDLISNETLRELAERAKTVRSRRYIAKVYECEIGFLCYDDWSDQSSGFIYKIFVLPDYRGQGIGRNLLLHSETLAKSLHCTSIKLEPHAFDRTVNLSWLISWYRKQGYKPMPDDPKKMEKFLAHSSLNPLLLGN